MHSKQFQSSLKTTVELIRAARRIILACHINPDGDALGSMLGLGLGLSKLKKSVAMLCPDKIPSRYDSLPGISRVRQSWRATADLAISVDCASIIQLSKLDTVFQKSKRIVEIDHHVYRTRFGDIQLVDQHACSVGEMVFLVLKELKAAINKEIAECLLTSILIETSSFSRQDVKPSTFEMCSQLMIPGIHFREISERYYWRKKLSATHLCGLCLTRATTLAKDRLVWSIVYKKDFERFRGRQEDVDTVADEMMMVENIKIAVLFREIDDNMLRVSLRSKDGIDVGYLASSYGGGGHPDIAGCRIHNNPRTIQKLISQACRLISRKIHPREIFREFS